MLDTKDIVEIQQLEAFCHHAVDFDDQSLFDQVFTEDARFDARLCGGKVYEGLEAIKAFFALGKPPHPPSHHMTNCFVYEEHGEIRVKMKWLCPDPGTGGVVVGDNLDRVVKTPHGWRIRERIARIRYPAGGFSGSSAS